MVATETVNQNQTMIENKKREDEVKKKEMDLKEKEEELKKKEEKKEKQSKKKRSWLQRLIHALIFSKGSEE